MFEIEKEAIRRWAEAEGDPNPFYHDEAHAWKMGYRSIVAPPSFYPITNTRRKGVKFERA